MLRLSLLAAALLAFASAPAHAQRQSSVPTRTTARAPRATAALADVERRGDRLARRISLSLDGARRGHERGVARCLSSHLSQVHGLLRQVEYRKLLLARRSAAGDARGAANIRRVASVYRQRLGSLDAGSRRCQGGDLEPRRGTVVVTEVDASVPHEDPTRLPGEVQPLFDLPSPLSPAI